MKEFQFGKKANIIGKASLDLSQVEIDSSVLPGSLDSVSPIIIPLAKGGKSDKFSLEVYIHRQSDAPEEEKRKGTTISAGYMEEEDGLDENRKSSHKKKRERKSKKETKQDGKDAPVVISQEVKEKGTGDEEKAENRDGEHDAEGKKKEKKSSSSMKVEEKPLPVITVSEPDVGRDRAVRDSNDGGSVSLQQESSNRNEGETTVYECEETRNTSEEVQEKQVVEEERTLEETDDDPENTDRTSTREIAPVVPVVVSLPSSSSPSSSRARPSSISKSSSRQDRTKQDGGGEGVAVGAVLRQVDELTTANDAVTKQLRDAKKQLR